MITVLFALALQGPVDFGTVELVGPLESAHWKGVAPDSADEWHTTIHVALGPGERRVVRVPMRNAGGAPLEDLRIEGPVEGAGDALFRGYDIRDPQPGEVSRTAPAGRPPAVAIQPSLGWGAWAALVAGLLAVVGLRRRPGLALAAGAVCAAGTLALGGGSPARSDRGGVVRVLDGAAGGRHWTLTQGAAQRLELPPGKDPFLWVEPRQSLSLSVREVGPSDLRVELQLLEPGAAWTRVDLVPGMRVLAPELNAWGAVLEAWSRPAGGAWQFHGPWPEGEALGPALGGNPALPPSWLVEGLPSTSGALLARLAPGAFAGPGRADEVWIRLRLE